MNREALETIELEMALLVRRITAISTEMKSGTLDRSAYLLLQHISALGTPGVKTLADVFGLDISTVSRQVAGLEQKGYVRKVPDPFDRRSFSLQMTDFGIKELSDYREERLKRFSRLLSDWSDEECRDFGRLLYKFNRSFPLSDSHPQNEKKPRS